MISEMFWLFPRLSIIRLEPLEGSRSRFIVSRFTWIDCSAFASTTVSASWFNDSSKPRVLEPAVTSSELSGMPTALKKDKDERKAILEQ